MGNMLSNPNSQVSRQTFQDSHLEDASTIRHLALLSGDLTALITLIISQFRHWVSHGPAYHGETRRGFCEALAPQRSPSWGMRSVICREAELLGMAHNFPNLQIPDLAFNSLKSPGWGY
jgi:hypothetical protein